MTLPPVMTQPPVMPQPWVPTPSPDPELSRLRDQVSDMQQEIADLRNRPEAPNVPPQASPDFYAPPAGPSDELDRRVRDLEDDVARADDELGKLRGLNDALRDEIARLQDAQRRAEERPTAQPSLVQVQPSQRDAEVDKRLGELADRNPESFQFDPVTGTSTFDADVFFDTGKDELRPVATALLEEFANVFQQAGARDTHIQIDGHTDNQPIGKPETALRHPTNWHLSIHRAMSVRRFLAEAGVPMDRMHVAGYSMHRPVASNDTAVGRQQNRRVEIRVLSANARPASDGDSTSLRTSSLDMGGSDGSLNVPTAVHAWRAATILRR